MAVVGRIPIVSMKVENITELDDKQLESLYMWVDEVPLSRAKKNLTRDFSDGVLVAELIQYFIPKLVEMHNYTFASSTRIKEHNWFHLNRKVLQKIGLEVEPEVIRTIAHCRPWAVENFLLLLRDKLDAYLLRKQGMIADAQPAHTVTISDAPEADQYPVKLSGKLQFVPHLNTEQLPSDRSEQGTRRVKPHLSPRNKAGQEMVPGAWLREKQDQLQMREETIQMLQAKVSGLEKLLSLKDLRIEDLNSRIKEMEEYNGPPARKPNLVRQHPEYFEPSQRGASKVTKGQRRGGGPTGRTADFRH